MPKVFRPEAPENKKVKPRTSEDKPAPSPNGNHKKLITRLKNMKVEWQNEDSILKNAISQASGEDKKALKKQRRQKWAELKLQRNKEVADTAEGIPLLGPIIGNIMNQGFFTQRAQYAILFGTTEEGPIPLDKKGQEAFKSYLESQKHRFKALISIASLVGLPEATLLKVANGGGKLAKAAKVAHDLERVHKFAKDAKLAKGVIEDISNKDVGWHTVVKASSPAIGIISPKLPSRAKKAAGLTARLIRRNYKDIAEAIENIPPDEDEKVEKHMNDFANIITKKPSELPLAA